MFLLPVCYYIIYSITLVSDAVQYNFSITYCSATASATDLLNQHSPTNSVTVSVTCVNLYFVVVVPNVSCVISDLSYLEMVNVLKLRKPAV